MGNEERVTRVGMLRLCARLLLIGVALSQAIRGQESPAPDAARAAEDLSYSVKVKSNSRWGRGKKLIVELTVVNEGAQPVTLKFAGNDRVCGEFHDPDNQRYFEFGVTSKEATGTETFSPNKKSLFRREIALDALPREPKGRNAVSAWLCGYSVQRAWEEFPLYGKPDQKK